MKLFDKYFDSNIYCDIKNKFIKSIFGGQYFIAQANNGDVFTLFGHYIVDSNKPHYSKYST